MSLPAIMFQRARMRYVWLLRRLELHNEIFGRISEPLLGISAMAGAVVFLTWLFS
jgi:hypothetical protein